MGRTVSELQYIDTNELIEWMAYNELDPIGEWRADARAALICDTMAKCFGNTDSKFENFMLKFGQEDVRPVSGEDLKAKALMVTMIQKAHIESMEMREKDRNG